MSGLQSPSSRLSEICRFFDEEIRPFHESGAHVLSPAGKEQRRFPKLVELQGEVIGTELLRNSHHLMLLRVNLPQIFFYNKIRAI